MKKFFLLILLISSVNIRASETIDGKFFGSWVLTEKCAQSLAPFWRTMLFCIDKKYIQIFSEGKCVAIQEVYSATPDRIVFKKNGISTLITYRNGNLVLTEEGQPVLVLKKKE